MTDRNVQYPTRYHLTKVDGTDDIYELTPAPGTVTEEGTLINKAALLKDATALLYGFTEDQLAGVVPDEVLSILSKAALYENGTISDVIGGNAMTPGDCEFYYTSYVGTHSSGQYSTISLTFPILPDIFVICELNSTASLLVVFPKHKVGFGSSGSSFGIGVATDINYSGNTVTFNTVYGNHNFAGRTYNVTALMKTQ